jgi:hypothetical protein
MQNLKRARSVLCDGVPSPAVDAIAVDAVLRKVPREVGMGGNRGRSARGGVRSAGQHVPDGLHREAGGDMPWFLPVVQNFPVALLAKVLITDFIFNDIRYECRVSSEL